MLTRIYRDESGISLAEVLIASAMASIIATAFLLVFSAFSRNVSLEEARASALTAVQGAASELTAELRQAVPIVDDGPIVEKLESTWGTAELIFHSDRADAPGPERYRYYLSNCAGSHCDLMRDVWVADAGTPPWTFTGAPTTERMIADLMTGGDPLFVGVEWNTGTEVQTNSCDATAACRFSLVEIVFRVDPDPNLAAEEPLRVRNNVRLRNA